MLKNIHIPAQSKRLYCTKFASVHNEEMGAMIEAEGEVGRP